MFGGRDFPKIHDRPSLHGFIRGQLRPDGSLADSACTLPDEAPPAPNGIGWVAGAFDGVMGHHAGTTGREIENAERLARAINEAAARPRKKELAAVYKLSSSNDVLSLIDTMMEALVELRPSASEIGRVGAWLASSSPERGPVKVGLALLGASGATHGTLLHELGAHEEFTLFAAVAFCNARRNPELDLFALAKRVHGWGRIHCVERLSDTQNPEIRRWILIDGFRNRVMNEYLALIAATTGELAAALDTVAPGRELLTAAADIIDALLDGGPAEDIDAYPDAPATLTRWLDHMDRHAETLGDLITIAQIRDFCDRDDWDQRLDAGHWTTEGRNAIRTHAARLFESPAWIGRVHAGLNPHDGGEFRKAERGARLLGIDAFDALVARIDADPLGGPWFQAWQGVDEHRALVLVERAARYLDLDLIASGPTTAIGLGPEFRVHAALGWSLQGIREHPGVGGQLVEAALVSPSIQNRHGALNVLETWGPRCWTDCQRDRLQRLVDTDPEPRVRARATEVLRRFDDHP